jgi:hypothetical protein
VGWHLLRWAANEALDRDEQLADLDGSREGRAGGFANRFPIAIFDITCGQQHHSQRGLQDFLELPQRGDGAFGIDIDE